MVSIAATVGSVRMRNRKTDGVLLRQHFMDSRLKPVSREPTGAEQSHQKESLGGRSGPALEEPS